jgi:hypothetical protein
MLGNRKVLPILPIDQFKAQKELQDEAFESSR